MAKESGIGDYLFFHTTDLSGDVGSVQRIAGPRGTQEVTGISSGAIERVLTLKDGEIAFNSFWNATAGQSVPILRALPTTDVEVSYAHGATLGNVMASLVGKQVNFDPTRGQDGSLISATQVLANGSPLEWGQMLTTGKQTFASGATNTTSIDYGSASTAFGAAGYLHVFSLGSGTPTVTIQDSADNSSFAAITGMGFTAITAATTERLQGSASATIRRYVRLAITGTYTNLVCAVNFVRYETSPTA